MVAKITSPARVIAALNYNEKKVQEGKAKCLHASGYLRKAEEMNFYHKLEGFERRDMLNTTATTKTLHISLNFDPSEKIGNDRLITIASEYMEKIGFGAQPWVMYKHTDAGHPHIHIVTTTIQENGKRINTYNIGRNQSEKARKEIEQKYGLIQAEKQKKLLHAKIIPLQLEKIGYGQTETKKGITNVVNAVLNTYRYCSLPEFNAVLKAYNVVADRGTQDGRIYRHGGLMYRILDANGNKVGVPIKASSISSKPTLEKLEQLFEKNKPIKEQLKASVKLIIDHVLGQQPRDLNSLIRQLSNRNVLTVLRQNEEGRIYGITFVDRINRCVFNGSDLGKAYSIAHLQDKLNTFSLLPVYQPQQLNLHTTGESTMTTDLLQTVANQREEFNYTPVKLMKKKKRKKKGWSLGL
jgi:hypothetical protein